MRVMPSSLKRDVIAPWLLQAYPRAWRARYGDEFMALLEQGMSWGAAADVLSGAIDAWTGELHAALRGPRGAEVRVIAAYVATQIAAFTIVRLAVGPGRPDVGLAWAVVYGVGYVALCLVLKARRSRRDVTV